MLIKERSSGDLTPSPTTGELSDLTPGKSSTPLKSLLKKPSFDEDDISEEKKVHFCETNQVKVLSQESLVSKNQNE